MSNPIVYPVPLVSRNALYVTSTGPVTLEQIKAMIARIMAGLRTRDVLRKVYNRDDVTPQEIITAEFFYNNPHCRNVSRDSNGNEVVSYIPQPYFYVWCSNPQVVNLLCGLNLDGSERVVVTPAPEPEVAPIVDWTQIDPNMSWADIAEEEDEQNATTGDTITVLPPLFSFSYPLTQEQLDKNPTVPTEACVNFGRAEIYSYDPRKSRNTLRVFSDAPERAIKEFYSRFTTDSTTEYARYLNGKVIPDTFPFVELCTTPHSTYYKVTFNPETKDGEFAVMMTKVLRAVPLTMGGVTRSYDINCNFSQVGDSGKSHYDVFVKREKKHFGNGRDSRDSKEARAERGERRLKSTKVQTDDGWTTSSRVMPTKKPVATKSTTPVTANTNLFAQLADME